MMITGDKVLTQSGAFVKYPARLKDLQDVAPYHIRLGAGATIYGDYELHDVEATPKPDEDLSVKADPILVGEVWTQQWGTREYTDSELKMIGIEFTDATGTNPDPMMLSAMAEDQWGLESVRRNVMAGLTVNYLFENGNILILNSANFDAMEAVWLPFRASFFQ